MAFEPVFWGLEMGCALLLAHGPSVIFTIILKSYFILSCVGSFCFLYPQLPFSWFIPVAF